MSIIIGSEEEINIDALINYIYGLDYMNNISEDIEFIFKELNNSTFDYEKLYL